MALGPYPADGFFGSNDYSKFDAILAMYHDQGLTAFKALSFDSGVNFTAGLSKVRTSPAHGTAYAIAGTNVASPESFQKALIDEQLARLDRPQSMYLHGPGQGLRPGQNRPCRLRYR